VTGAFRAMHRMGSGLNCVDSVSIGAAREWLTRRRDLNRQALSLLRELEKITPGQRRQFPFLDSLASV